MTGTTLHQPNKQSHKSCRTSTIHHLLPTHVSNMKFGPSHRISYSNAWKSQATWHHSHHNRKPHKGPLQFLCDLAYAKLNDETGDLLEYCHLMKHPKYKDTWTKSFSKEIICLTTHLFCQQNRDPCRTQGRCHLRPNSMHIPRHKEGQVLG
jgi:hypothetical protein